MMTYLPCSASAIWKGGLLAGVALLVLNVEDDDVLALLGIGDLGGSDGASGGGATLGLVDGAHVVVKVANEAGLGGVHGLEVLVDNGVVGTLEAKGGAVALLAVGVDVEGVGLVGGGLEDAVDLDALVLGADLGGDVVHAVVEGLGGVLSHVEDL